MALNINRPDAEPAAAFVTPERLCVDETRERIVPCGSAAARWLLAGAGCEVPAEAVARYGLAPGEAIEPDAAGQSPPVPASRRKAKAGPPADKGG